METKLTDRQIVKQSYKMNFGKFNLSALSIDILSLFYAQIKREDTEFKSYKVSFKELEEKLDKKIHREYIRNSCLELLKNPLEIKESEKTFLYCNFVSSARANYEENWLELKISDDLKKHLLQVESHFVLTNYKTIAKLTGANAKRIYSILSQYKKLKQFQIDVEELMNILGLNGKYKKYNDFKKRVIEVAAKDITENSEDLIVTYEEIKEGRKVVAIKFFIKQNKYIATSEDELEIDRITEIEEKFNK